MNITEEVKKLIAEYFRKHNEVLMNGKDAMLRDNYAKLDAIDLVCDIANVYNSVVYQCAIGQLEEAFKDSVSITQRSYTPQEIGEAISKSAKAIYNDSYHVKGEDK